jgi:ABC-2 type transport system permease protein
MGGLFLRIFRQMLNDRRSLAFMLIAPLLILSLLYLLLGESSYVPSAGVSGLPDKLLNALEAQDITVIRLDDSEDADDLLEDKKIDAALSFGADGMNIRMQEPDSVRLGKITDAVRSAMAEINPSAAMNISYIHGDGTDSAFDSMGYALLGVMSFFVVFLLSGVAFIRERTTGTMERLMLTPISRASVMGGYTLGFGFFAALQSSIVIIFAEYVLRLHFEGSLLLAVLIMILLAFTAVAVGTLVSIFANSEFQVVQFIPVIIIPQIFFSGIMPVDTFPYGLGKLAFIMPVYYGCAALKEVLKRGAGINDILFYLGILALFIIVLSVINTLALKKYRQL